MITRFGARSAVTLTLLLVLGAACDGGPADDVMTAATADLTGTYSMLPVEDSDDPFVGAGTVRFEMTAVTIVHAFDLLSGSGRCRWTYTPNDPLGAPFTQVGQAVLEGSYDGGFMELVIAGDHCPAGAFAGTWTTPDTLVFDIGSSFDDGLVLVLDQTDS